jgi:hypothetical protein
MSVELIQKARLAAETYAAENLEWSLAQPVTEGERRHIVDIAASIIMTRDNILQGGGFVEAIIANNLSQAISRADSTCIRALKFFVMVKDNAGKF